MSDDLARSSMLNADAQEFVPRFMQAPAGDQQYSAQHPPDLSSYGGGYTNPALPYAVPSPMVLGAWGTPMGPMAPQMGMGTPMYHQLEQQDVVYNPRNNFHNISAPEFRPAAHATAPSAKGEPSAAEILRATMHELTLNPGEFDTLVSPLGDNIEQWLQDQETISGVVDQVVEHSVAETNFRYSGAKLLNLINTIDATPNNTFRALLLERCQQENTKVRDQFTAGGDASRLQSFTLFLAELFIQLELSKGSGLRVGVLGHGLIEDLGLLLARATQGDNASLKCACQVLKLAGSQLETAVGTKAMDELERQLQESLTVDAVTANMKFLAETVINLRRTSWGRSTSSPETPHPPSSAELNSQTQWSEGQNSQNNHFMDEPVQYGPDGQMLTAEERKFLQDELDRGLEGSEDEYDDETIHDEAFQEAYEEFLQLPPHSRPS